MADQANTGARVEEALEENKALLEVRRKQREQLRGLEAHRKTLVWALAGHRTSYAAPAPLPLGPGAAPLAVPDKYPFYVLSFGDFSPRGELASALIPHGYKVVRRFPRHLASSSPYPEIFYTTVLLNKSDNMYLIIKDDENNIWKGFAAFEHFRQAFGVVLPVRTAVEWLGLDRPQIKKRLMAMRNEVADRKGAAAQHSLDEYFL